GTPRRAGTDPAATPASPGRRRAADMQTVRAAGRGTRRAGGAGVRTRTRTGSRARPAAAADRRAAGDGAAPRAPRRSRTTRRRSRTTCVRYRHRPCTRSTAPPLRRRGARGTLRATGMERTENPGAGPEALFRLVIVNDHSVQTFPLRGNRWVIGRGSECDVRLRDAAVSRKHVLLERTGDAFVFSDLGSVNPVLLDGKLVRAGAWQVGQTLLVGMTRILLDRVQTGGEVETDPGDTIVIERLDFVPPVGAAASQDLSLHLDPTQLSQLFECMGWVVA